MNILSKVLKQKCVVFFHQKRMQLVSNTRIPTKFIVSKEKINLKKR